MYLRKGQTSGYLTHHWKLYTVSIYCIQFLVKVYIAIGTHKTYFLKIPKSSCPDICGIKPFVTENTFGHCYLMHDYDKQIIIDFLVDNLGFV